MNKLISIFGLFLIFSCKNSETIEIDKAEYNKLKNLPPERILTIGNQEDRKILVGSDNHEYYAQKVGMSGYAIGDIYLHYVDCKFCAKRIKTDGK